MDIDGLLHEFLYKYQNLRWVFEIKDTENYYNINKYNTLQYVKLEITLTWLDESWIIDEQW